MLIVRILLNVDLFVPNRIQFAASELDHNDALISVKRRHKSLGSLSKKFVTLFLVQTVSNVTRTQHIVQTLLKSTIVSARTRRLTEVVY